MPSRRQRPLQALTGFTWTVLRHAVSHETVLGEHRPGLSGVRRRGGTPLTSGDAVSGVLRALTPSRHPSGATPGDQDRPQRHGCAMQAGHSPATHSHRSRADPHCPWGTHLAVPVFHGNPAPARPQTRPLVSRGTASSRPTTSHMPVQQAPPAHESPVVDELVEDIASRRGESTELCTSVDEPRSTR